jgi:hypothetical protein
LEQELLLSAALSEGEKALHAWEAWRAKVDLNNHLDSDSYRLLPLLFHNMLRHDVKEPVMQKLKGIYRMAWYKNQTALRCLASLLRILHDAGIRTMIVNGTALSVWHYENLGLRPLDGVDILVPFAQIADTITVLKQEGWSLEPSLANRPIGILLATKAALTFVGQTGQKLKLHWHVLHERRGPEADEPFWQAALATEVDKEATSTLSPTDQLLQICVEGESIRTLPSICWVADAMMVLRRSSPAIDWQRLLTHTQERLLVLPFGAAMAYLHDIFDAPIPSPALQKLQDRSTARMERWEARYLASRYRHLPFGDIPFFWFDYLRSRKLSERKGRLRSFAEYLRQRADSSTSWQLPFYLLLACGRRIRRLATGKN